MMIIAGSSISTGSVSRSTERRATTAAGAAGRARAPRLDGCRCGAHSPANSSSIFFARFWTASCAVSWPFITFWISPSKMLAPSRPPHFGDGG